MRLNAKRDETTRIGGVVRVKVGKIKKGEVELVVMADPDMIIRLYDRAGQEIKLTRSAQAG